MSLRLVDIATIRLERIVATSILAILPFPCPALVYVLGDRLAGHRSDRNSFIAKVASALAGWSYMWLISS